MNTGKLPHMATSQVLILLKRKYQSWYLYQLFIFDIFKNKISNVLLVAHFQNPDFFFSVKQFFLPMWNQTRRKNIFFGLKKWKNENSCQNWYCYPIPVLTSSKRAYQNWTFAPLHLLGNFFQKVFRSGFLIGTQSEKKFSELLHQTGIEKNFFLFTSKE